MQPVFSQLLFPLAVAGSLCWLIVSSLWIYPHSLSYFNESIGGPLNGPNQLLGSNVDWGQDLRYLQEHVIKADRQQKRKAVYLGHHFYSPSDLVMSLKEPRDVAKSQMSDHGDGVLMLISVIRCNDLADLAMGGFSTGDVVKENRTQNATYGILSVELE